MQVVLVSIGKPEIGLQLCGHLGVENGPEFIFAGELNDECILDTMCALA